MTSPDTDRMPRQGLDRRGWLLWFVAGVVVALLMQWGQVQTLGGEWNSLLSTWDEGPLRPVIEEQLGDITVVGQGGHDGQVSYVVALDPLGTEYGDLRDDSGLRWRRILYPLIAGVGGLLSGHALLVSLTIVAALGLGLAVSATADLVALARRRRWVIAGVLANPGAWLGAMLLTPDPLALGFSLAAVSAFVRKRSTSTVVLLALAALTKDQYILVAVGLAAYAFARGRRREAALLVGGPVVPIAMWNVYIALSIGGLTETNASIAAPFAGILDGLGDFSILPADERLMLLGAYAMVLLAAAVAWTTRTQLLRYLAVPWLVLTPFLSHWVWQTGNNPLRVLAPLWLVAMFGVDEWLTRGRADAIASGSRFDATSRGHETEPTARNELVDPADDRH